MARTSRNKDKLVDFELRKYLIFCIIKMSIKGEETGQPREDKRMMEKLKGNCQVNSSN